MAFTAQDVKELREITGCGMMDCKKALTETDGDKDKAIEFLREKGLATAAKKSGRIAAEGIVAAKVEGNTGVLVEVNCETDFAAKNPQLFATAKDLAMQVVATNPIAVSPADLSANYVAEQKELFLAQLKNDPKNANKPQMVLDKIIEGKLNKHFEEVCLLNQAFIKDGDKTVQDVINDLTLVIGEKITVRRFVRWEVGEGLEKRQDDFAAEVAAQAGGNV